MPRTQTAVFGLKGAQSKLFLLAVFVDFGIHQTPSLVNFYFFPFRLPQKFMFMPCESLVDSDFFNVVSVISLAASCILKPITGSHKISWPTHWAWHPCRNKWVYWFDSTPYKVWHTNICWLIVIIFFPQTLKYYWKIICFLDIWNRKWFN